MTKNRQIEIYNRYKKSEMRDLYNLYKSCSMDKARAYGKIREEMGRIDGYGLKILGGNCFMFSCAYMYEENLSGKNQKHLVYHTAYNRYDFIVE